MVEAGLMAYPLSKIAAPAPLPDAVRRPRLLAQLDSPLGLTLLVAPAGSGKTVLLSTWLHSSPHHTLRTQPWAPRGRKGQTGQPAPEPLWLWYALDTEDRDAARFVDGL